MPGATPGSVRKQIADRTLDPIYLIVGDDEAEMSRLAADMSGIVEDELRAFNVERLYAGEKSVTPASIVEAVRTLPMMSDRRVVVVLRAERILKPKRRGAKGGEEESAGGAEDAPADTDVLDAYAKNPVPETTLVLVASDVDRTRRLYKTLQKQATIVECWGLKGARDGGDLRQAARQAEMLVRQAVAQTAQHI